MNSTRSQLAKKIMQEAGFRKAVFNNAELWAYSDSLLNAQPLKMAVHITTDTPLFSFRDKTYTATDWITYSQTFRYKPDGSGIKPYQQVWDEFLEASALDYYQSHLEKYNEEFRQQINEFRDGNLFFEIMQNKVWGPAQTDSLALVSYFEKNRQKYNWKQSAEAVIFYAPDAATAKNFAASIKKNPANWRELVSDMSEKIAADSSRFELEQLPNPTRLSLKAGTVTAPLLNKADNTASFAYIVKLHAETSPRNFAEARGLVITDYQNELEKNWIAELRRKYPVTINEKVLNELKAKK
jgi:peptidyl-prolyl cis-trans isomerase SurA